MMDKDKIIEILTELHEELQPDEMVNLTLCEEYAERIVALAELLPHKRESFLNKMIKK